MVIHKLTSLDLNVNYKRKVPEPDRTIWATRFSCLQT